MKTFCSDWLRLAAAVIMAHILMMLTAWLLSGMNGHFTGTDAARKAGAFILH